MTDEIRDELPEDLDAAGFVGPYRFPDNSRRRWPGVLYLVIAAGCVLLYAAAGDEPWVNEGFLLGAALPGWFDVGTTGQIALPLMAAALVVLWFTTDFSGPSDADGG